MFLDFGIGIFLSILWSAVFDVALNFKLVALGILFSVTPDLDVFAELLQRGRVGGRVHGHHRKITHFPLTYIPVALLIGSYYGNVWTWFFLANVLAHFVHDSIGTGWGIQWWWPFSRKSYKFFSEKIGRLSSKKLIVCWQPEELKKVIYAYGDDHWFRNFYLRFHPLAIFELLIFILSVIVLLYYVV